MSVARFIADQRTNYRVPHTLTCLLLGGEPGLVLQVARTGRSHRGSGGGPTSTPPSRPCSRTRRGCTARPGCTPTCAPPAGVVTEKTVADSMRRQGLVARKVKRRRGLTRQDRTAPKFPDLVRRDFTATAPNLKWCGDMTEIPTGDGKLYLATVIDLYSRRLLGRGDQPALRRGVVRAGDQDRRRGPRRPDQDQQCGVPHRPRIDLHRSNRSPGFVLI